MKEKDEIRENAGSGSLEDKLLGVVAEQSAIFDKYKDDRDVQVDMLTLTKLNKKEIQIQTAIDSRDKA
jgi:hypothetical protein